MLFPEETSHRSPPSQARGGTDSGTPAPLSCWLIRGSCDFYFFFFSFVFIVNSARRIFEFVSAGAPLAEEEGSSILDVFRLQRGPIGPTEVSDSPLIIFPFQVALLLFLFVSCLSAGCEQGERVFRFPVSCTREDKEKSSKCLSPNIGETHCLSERDNHSLSPNIGERDILSLSEETTTPPKKTSGGTKRRHHLTEKVRTKARCPPCLPQSPCHREYPKHFRNMVLDPDR